MDSEEEIGGGDEEKQGQKEERGTCLILKGGWVAVLPHYERVFAKVVHVVELTRVELEEDPAHVSPEEALRDVVWVRFLVHVLVVDTVIG